VISCVRIHNTLDKTIKKRQAYSDRSQRLWVGARALWQDWSDVAEECFEDREADIGRFPRQHLGPESATRFIEIVASRRVRRQGVERSMPRISRGPYLKLRKRAGAKTLWYIHDSGRWIATGVSAEDGAGARQAFSDYLAQHISPTDFKQQTPTNLSVSEVVILYATDSVPNQSRPDEARMRLTRIVEFFGDMACEEITPSTTKAYERWRTHAGGVKHNEPPRRDRAVKTVTARRELVDLQSALRHAWKSRKLSVEIPVTLPPAGQPRDRWLTRSEAARLLLGAMGFILAPCSDVASRTERWIIWRRAPEVTSRHICRFILIGLRTGTRHDAILAMGWHQHLGGGFFDLENQMMFRAASGKAQTKKRQTPTPIPKSLARHLPRWKRLSDSLFVVSATGHGDERQKRIHKAFSRAVARSGLDRSVTPHVLRHTCATWLMQRGRPAWEVAGFLGMTVAMIERVYGHHSPSYLRETADA
jgi:integrase